jgi:hypothetical protein
VLILLCLSNLSKKMLTSYFPECWLSSLCSNGRNQLCVCLAQEKKAQLGLPSPLPPGPVRPRDPVGHCRSLSIPWSTTLVDPRSVLFTALTLLLLKLSKKKKKKNPTLLRSDCFQRGESSSFSHNKRRVWDHLVL